MFQLAENLGMTVARLSDELTYNELEKWLLFYESKSKNAPSTEAGVDNPEDWTPEKVKEALSI